MQPLIKKCDCEKLNCGCWWKERLVNLPQTALTTEQFIEKIIKDLNQAWEERVREAIGENEIKNENVEDDYRFCNHTHCSFGLKSRNELRQEIIKKLTPLMRRS